MQQHYQHYTHQRRSVAHIYTAILFTQQQYTQAHSHITLIPTTALHVQTKRRNTYLHCDSICIATLHLIVQPPSIYMQHYVYLRYSVTHIHTAVLFAQ